MNNNSQRPRIDSSTPKSFYCSPKSYHYIPFAQRRSQSADFKRQTGNKLNPSSISEAQSCQNRLRSKLSEQSRPYLFTKQNTSNKHSSVSPTSFKTPLPNTNRSVRSVIVQTRNNQLQLPVQQRNKKVFNSSESKIPPQTANCIYGNDDEEIQEKLDQFKNEILDDIIQCGVYTDSVIQECISRNVVKNSTLTMENLQQAITELLKDIGVFNIEVNKMTWIANSEGEEMLNYEDEEFESDEGESSTAIPSVESDSEKLAKEDKSVASDFGSVSIRTTDSLTTLSNSSVIETSN